MTQLYYRDLQKRIEALEAEFFPEPELEVTVCWLDEDGLPEEIIVMGRGRWKRRENEPIPPAVLKFAKPEARAAYQARKSPPG